MPLVQNMSVNSLSNDGLDFSNKIIIMTHTEGSKGLKVICKMHYHIYVESVAHWIGRRALDQRVWGSLPDFRLDKKVRGIFENKVTYS